MMSGHAGETFLMVDSIECDIRCNRKDNGFYFDYHSDYQHFGQRMNRRMVRHDVLTENPIGQWNVIELICVGQTAIHKVNGIVVMVNENISRRENGKNEPLTHGRLQLQSEGAELFIKSVSIRKADKSDLNSFTLSDNYGYKNPVLPGFYPDPSVCRVGDDYYMVNSSFQYFPGVPIHHSRDLVHWEQIGNCLTRQSQLKLDGAGFWNGIYAPSIRYNNGKFYMVTTNTSDKGNFYVVATDPAGPWSEPVWVEQQGIDPDLFFDDDGTTYMLTARGGGHMHLAKIDINTGKLLTEPRTIWSGTGDRCAEAPHIYKKDGYYYLMIAEGGTEYGHKAVIARSRDVWGPYEACPHNPILTQSRAGGLSQPIQGTGHADMVQAHDGSWWAVHLGFRPQSHTHHLLGRETFLAPVIWNEDGWPIMGKGGVVYPQMDVPTLPQQPTTPHSGKDDFDKTELSHEWVTLCRPHPDNISTTERKGWLRLKPNNKTIDDTDSPVMLLKRMQHINFEALSSFDVSHLSDDMDAGLSLYMSTAYHYDLKVQRRNGHTELVLIYRLGHLHHIEASVIIDTKAPLKLRIIGNKNTFSFYYANGGNDYKKLGEMDTRFLSSETAGGFTGVMFGLFIQKKNEKDGYIDIDYFDYISKD